MDVKEFTGVNIKKANCNDITAKPFVKWVGGKRSIINTLIDHIPNDFNDYYEPFVGGGALLYKIHDKAKNCYISDINSELITTYQVIKDELDKLIKILDKHKKNHSREYYNKIRAQQKSKDRVKTAARFIYLNKTCFNGLYRVNQKGDFNTPIGRYKNPNILDIENLQICNATLQKVNIKKRSFNEIKPKENDFIYIDPPYHQTDSNSFTSYTSTGFTEKNQTELKEFITELTKKNVKVMLSNSNTDFINNLYRSKIFNITTVSAPRFVNCKADKRSPIKEMLIKNYQ